MNAYKPDISIITPAHNSAYYISETIESVRAQSFENWEMIIVDDGSVDDTIKVVSQWGEKDSRIRLIVNSTNAGPGPTRNTAIKNANGRYLAFLDSDDLWYPDKLEKQFSHIQKTDAPLVYSSYSVIDESGNDLNHIVHAPESIAYSQLLSNTVIGCLTVIIDTQKVVNPRMPAIPSRQPLVLWLRILKEYGEGKGLDVVLAQYRVRSHSVSSNKIKAAQQVWKVYREYEKLNFLESVFNFFIYAINGTIRNRKSINKRK